MNYKEKTEKVKDILNKYSYPKNELDYILTGGIYKATTNLHFYPYVISSTYKELKKLLVFDEEDILKRFFQIVFNHRDRYDREDLVASIINHKKVNKEYDRLLKILGNAEISIVSILSGISEFDDSSNTVKYITKTLNEKLKPENYDSILTEIELNSKDELSRQVNLLAKYLLEKDYSRYIYKISEILGKTNYTYDFSSYINLFKGNIEFIHFITNKLRAYEDAENKFDDNFFNNLRRFLETGELTKEFSDNCEKVNKTNHYSHIYNYFVRPLSKNYKFYNRMLKLSVLLSGNVTYQSIIYTDNKFKENMINTFVELGLNLNDQLEILLYNYTYIDKGISKNYLQELVSIDFYNILNKLDVIAKDSKEISSLIPLLWEYNKDEFYPYLLNLTVFGSLKVQNAIFTCLNDYKDGFHDYENMLKSKKQSERVLAVKILISLNIPSKVNPLLADLLKKEKTKKVQLLVENYFNSLK